MTWKDMRSHSRDSFSPRFCISLSLSVKRAQGKPGADCARSPVCESPVEKSARVKLQVQPGHPGFPRAMVYGLYVLSPAFLAPVAGGKTRQRSARVAAPGPHDFAFSSGAS